MISTVESYKAVVFIQTNKPRLCNTNANTVTFQRESKRPRISKEKDEVLNRRRIFPSHKGYLRSAGTNRAEATVLQLGKPKLPVNITYTVSDALTIALFS